MPDLPLIMHKQHIESLTNLADGHPIFQMIWSNTPYIIKGDPGSERTMMATYGLMREVARGVKSRPLDKQETRWMFEKAAEPGICDDGTRDYMARLQQAPYVWVIMGNKAVLLELDKVLDNNDVASAVSILLAMSDDENLRRLGAILVVDMFNNNTDRFRILPNSRGIQNKGNIFFVKKDDGTLRIKGLDPFDYTQNNALLETTVTKVKDVNDGSYWSGSLLKKDSELKRVARNACESLNEELGGVLRHGGYSEKVIKQLSLGSKQIDKVVAAMKVARLEIQQHCTAYMGRWTTGRGRGPDAAQAVAGLKSRMDLLGWKT